MLPLQNAAYQTIRCKLAQKCMRDYSEKDATMQKCAEAMSCRDCEDLLRSGIEAFKWLKQSENTLQEAAKAGIQVSMHAKEAIDYLYRAWLMPCEHAEPAYGNRKKRDSRLPTLRNFKRLANTSQSASWQSTFMQRWTMLSRVASLMMPFGQKQEGCNLISTYTRGNRGASNGRVFPLIFFRAEV